ncbi:hypothetical protein [Algisphaera agarilytica]|uniref:DUF1570 domain-containing protein n=1 Tax=Algisphaera agarilytica TaxID=1385975 RepID=A0A7X0LJP9_9BACT|nr:hypothetical protein [Algisphaera agarilytica]MBB6429600.1 hypothetical protein [Algisphaera agarilytica]
MVKINPYSGRLIGLVIALIAFPAIGEEVSVVFDPPKRIIYRDADGVTQRRAIEGYDLEFVQMGGRKFKPVAWSDLGPKASYEIFRLVLRDGDGEDWLGAGLILQNLEPPYRRNRSRGAMYAFDRAVELDPSLAERVAELRAEPAQPATEKEQAEPETAEPHEPHHVETDHGDNEWPQLTEEEHQRLTESEVRWTREHLDALGLDYRVMESEHFVVLADRNLGKSDAKSSLQLLEKMYGELLGMFNLESDDQVYAGKCTVVIIHRREDFRAYEQRAYNYDASSAAGVCHYRAQGAVQIVARRSDDEWFYRKMLVHENVHGFLHRYRSSARVPTWLNEGLAEYIAHRLVPQSTVVESRRRKAHVEIHKGDLGQLTGIFDNWSGGSWAYGLSYGLTDLMIEGDKKAYKNLIHDIKDGVTWKEALETNFRCDPARLLSTYCQHHGLPDPTR